MWFPYKARVYHDLSPSSSEEEFFYFFSLYDTLDLDRHSNLDESEVNDVDESDPSSASDEKVVWLDVPVQ